MVRLAHGSILSAARAATGFSLATSVSSARLVTAIVQGTGVVTRAVAGAAANQAADTARHVVSQAVEAVPRRYTSVLGSLTDVGTGCTVRRVWSRDGRAHIEVKGLSGRGSRHRRIAADVTSALVRLKGVHWAQVNAVTRLV